MEQTKTAKQYGTRAAALLQRIRELSLITDEPGIINRVYGTPAFVQAGSLVLSWMEEAGLEAHIDPVGNIRGRWDCGNPAAKTLLIGSHYDTVVDAGAFDGPLGILLGLDLLELVTGLQQQLPFHIELLAFCDEEGVRFHTTYLGSKAVAGLFETELLDKRDEQGIALRQAIQAIGGDPGGLAQASVAGKELLGYIEAHIEQGPVLYERAIPVAVVTGIAGQKRILLSFTGEAGHAGTVPMPMRRDALCCAAACILAIEDFARQQAGLVATVGKLDIPHAASNVIPGKVDCTLDLRSTDEEELAAAWQSLQKVLNDICRQRAVLFSYNMVQSSAPVSCDPRLIRLLSRAIGDAGHQVVSLSSGAGHDVVPLSAICPVAMLFVRCYKGISHHPLEDVEEDDIAATIQVMEGFLKQMVFNYDQ
ncbi:MAG: allantoate amidohydrolase [Williamsia sp.]|nr:allantoate amidohydrolase [Williamsia sp.]